MTCHGIFVLVGLIFSAQSAGLVRAQDKPSKKATSKEEEKAKPANEGLRKELLERVEKDQAARKAMIDLQGKPDQELIKKLTEIDRANTEWMEGIIAQHGWPGKSQVGADGAQAAWLLVQHADLNREFQRQCLPLLKEAAEKGEASKQNLAYLTDRVLVGEGKKQLYGTQLSSKEGKLTPQPIEDEANVDVRRKEAGLRPLAEYIRFAEGMYKTREPAKEKN